MNIQNKHWASDRLFRRRYNNAPKHWKSHAAENGFLSGTTGSHGDLSVQKINEFREIQIPFPVQRLLDFFSCFHDQSATNSTGAMSTELKKYYFPLFWQKAH